MAEKLVKSKARVSIEIVGIVSKETGAASVEN